MKLTVLVDNNTFIDQYFLGEPAVSYYIETADEKILFDTGYSDVFIQNARKLHIPLEKTTKIILSHGHNDHTGGFPYFCRQYNLSNMELISHPDVFHSKKLDNEFISTPLSTDTLKNTCKLSCTTLPVSIAENMFFLGEIPQSVPFEPRRPLGMIQRKNGLFTDDLLFDDSAIVYKSSKGLFIITGCSHSGICNIIEYAKKVCGCQTVYGVIGGFHLFDVNEQLTHTISYFKENNISLLYPCHCVSFQVKAAINHNIEISDVGVGLTIEVL